MKFNENDKFGFYTFVINIIITLFLLSSKDDFKVMFIVAMISNVVAIILNAYVIKISNKKGYNLASLVINIIFLLLVLLYGLKKLQII